MKHDIADVASYKTKQCNKFSFSTMSVTVGDSAFVMSVMFCDRSLSKCLSQFVMGSY